MSAQEIAFALGGRHAQRLSDGSYLTRCPLPSHGKGRGDHSPSLSLRDGDRGLLVYCHAGCDALDILEVIRGKGGTVDQPRAAPAPYKRQQHDQLARVIWNEAIDAHGTPVERYLATRHLTLPSGAEVLRFHPACPLGSRKTPAMVALVRNIESNQPQAIHRTALDRTGKMSLGPISGGAIKLTPDEDVTIALGIAEGIETALSMQRLPEWLGSPVWSVISASGIAKFPLLAGIETLVISADNDGTGGAGEKATIEVVERWQERETLVIEADDEGADLNDILQRKVS
jgi:putative DNA primase/helicase